MITDYDSLKDFIRTWIDRIEMDEEVETFIQLFETEAILDNRIRDTVENSSLTIPANGEVALPDGFQEVVGWTLNGAGNRHPLAALSPSAVSETNLSAGTPRGYYIVPGYASDGSESFKARVVPSPGSNVSSTLVYRRSITPLSATDPSNWLLKRYPAIYAYGSLAETAMYLKDDARLPAWMAKKEEYVNRLFDIESRREFSGPTSARHQLGGSIL